MVSGQCIFAHWDLILRNVESWSLNVPIHPLWKENIFGFKFSKNTKSRCNLLKEPPGKCFLYWNYKDEDGTKAEGKKFDVNYSRDLCWIFVLWMEEKYLPKYCWKNEVVPRGKLIILILLQFTEGNNRRHQEMDYGHKCLFFT